MDDQRFVIYRRGGPSRPQSLGDLRRLARAGGLKPSTIVQTEDDVKPRRAETVAALREILDEAKGYRLVSEVYKRVAAGRIWSAKRAARRLKRLSAALKGDPFAQTAAEFLEQLNKLATSGALARSLVRLGVGLACLMILVLFSDAARSKGIELVVEAQEGVAKALETKQEQLVKAELDATCHLIENSPHVRLARLFGLGEVGQWLDGATKQRMEVVSSFEETARRRMALDRVRERAEKLMLDHRYRDALGVVREAPDSIGGPEAEAFVVETAATVRSRSAEYFTQRAAHVRGLLTQYKFSAARKEMTALENQLVRAVTAEAFAALSAHVARAEQVMTLLEGARKAAEAGNRDELEKQIRRIEAVVPPDRAPEPLSERIATLRELALTRAKQGLREALDARLATLIGAHRYADALKSLGEAERDPLLADYARKLAVSVSAQMRSESQALTAKVRQLIGKRLYADALAATRAYGKTGVSATDKALVAIERETVTDARRLVAELRGRAEGLANQGKAAEALRTLKAIGPPQQVADVAALKKQAVAYIETLNKGVSYVRFAESFEKNNKPSQAEHYYRKALEVLPSEHPLASEAKRKLDALKKKR